MIKEYARKSFIFGIPGIFLIAIGSIVEWVFKYREFGSLIYLMGVALLMAGIANYAKARKRTPVWCLLALIPLGILFLPFLKDRSDTPSSGVSSFFFYFLLLVLLILILFSLYLFWLCR